jgi:non-homologous end joining protein Ku
MRVPVKLYSALDRKTVRFHQLSSKTGTLTRPKLIVPLQIGRGIQEFLAQSGACSH